MAYRELQEDAFMRNRAESATHGSSQYDYYKPKVAPADQPPAKNVLRLMPPHENMSDCIVAVQVHFSLGPTKKVASNCLKFFGEACPACIFVLGLWDEAKATTDPVERAVIEKHAKDCKAKYRYFANIIDIDKPEKGVQRYAFSVIEEPLLRGCFFGDEGEFRNITHPHTGRDILLFAVKQRGTDFNEYPTVRAKEAATPLHDMGWLDMIQDLSELIKKPTKEQVEAALRGERLQSAGAATAAARPPAAVAAAAKPVTVAKPPVPVTAPPVAAAPPAAAAPAAAVPGKTRKAKPVEEAPPVEAQDNSHPYARALAIARAAGFEPIALTPEENERIKKPPCYRTETDPADTQCATCRVFLACATENEALLAAAGV